MPSTPRKEDADAKDAKKREYGRKATQKRIGHSSARSLNAEKVVEENLTHYRKSKNMDASTRGILSAGVKNDRLCATLSNQEIESILNGMEYYEFSAKTPIIEEGKTGTTFFVLVSGTLEVSVNGVVCNTVSRGCAFGGLALLYNCPRTASVKATEASGVWGASGEKFKKTLQENAQKNQKENLKFLSNLRVFDGLSDKKKVNICEATFSETYEDKTRVVTAGEMQTALYFVKKGELSIYTGGTVKSTGEFVDGSEISRLGPGDCFGESQMLKQTPWDITILSAGNSEVACISVADLKAITGDDLGRVLESNFILNGLTKCPIMSQFSSSQRFEIAKHVTVSDYTAKSELEEHLRFVMVLDGELQGTSKTGTASFKRGDWLEDGSLLGDNNDAQTDIASYKLVAGPGGSRVAILNKEGLARVLKQLGLSAIGTAEDASDYTHKMVLAKKVHIFRHLSEEQTKKLVNSFVSQRMAKGSNVIKQGEAGTSFFVIATGEVEVFIDGRRIRTMGKNSYFGERALLFDEPRTATVEVLSAEAELWSVEKDAFAQIVQGNMQEELMKRIRLQDTNFGMKDLKQVKVIGAGAAGVVRLVTHKKTGMRYALKRVHKVDGQVPEEVQRECSLLKDFDHPFIMTQVNTFETSKSVYILTELITGGELHGAIREIPTVLSRAQGQFYTGTLVIVLEELSSRSIVYRDLKPENVMLDAQGYLKLIDFGIAKRLDEETNRTFTMIGTPHYMAPEVMRGHGYGVEVDLWSMGVMLFEFVCGYLPFADDLDDPTGVCTAVLKDPLSFPSSYKDQNGKAIMKALLTRQPRKRLGSGISGWEDVRGHEWFKMGHEGSSLFDKLLGRELQPPVMPKGETYADPEELDVTLSDAGELG